MTERIHSEHLDLVLLGQPFLRASLEGNIQEAERLLQTALPPSWPDCADLLSLRLEQLENDPGYQPWSLRAIVLRDHNAMVGHIGFHSAPRPDYLDRFSPGAVEFGFEVFAPFRRRGYAREASRALMHWAQHVHGVTEFILSIRPDNMASQALAAQLGFVRIGFHIDEVDGLEDVLERQVRRGDPS